MYMSLQKLLYDLRPNSCRSGMTCPSLATLSPSWPSFGVVFFSKRSCPTQEHSTVPLTLCVWACLGCCSPAICHKHLLDHYLSQILMIKLDNFHLHWTVVRFKIGYSATFSICLCQCMVRLGSLWDFADINFFFKDVIYKNALIQTPF